MLRRFATELSVHNRVRPLRRHSRWEDFEGVGLSDARPSKDPESMPSGIPPKGAAVGACHLRKQPTHSYVMTKVPGVTSPQRTVRLPKPKRLSSPRVHDGSETCSSPGIASSICNECASSATCSPTTRRLRSAAVVAAHVASDEELESLRVLVRQGALRSKERFLARRAQHGDHRLSIGSTPMETTKREEARESQRAVRTAAAAAADACKLDAMAAQRSSTPKRPASPARCGERGAAALQPGALRPDLMLNRRMLQTLSKRVWIERELHANDFLEQIKREAMEAGGGGGGDDDNWSNFSEGPLVEKKRAPRSTKRLRAIFDAFDYDGSGDCH